MNKAEVETVGSPMDTILVALAVFIALAGLVGFSFWSELPLAARFGILVGGVVVGAAVGWFSQPGKRFLAFAQDAWEETKKVTWPSRKETGQQALAVFVFVIVMSIFLFVVDKVIEWGLYDVILGWKR